MNATRRKALSKAETLLIEAQELVSQCATEEQEAYDNLSEGAQTAERGQEMENAAGELTSLADDLQNAVDTIGNLTAN